MPFVKGQSGNPKGRVPVYKSIMKVFGESVAPQREIILKKIIGMALDGNEAMLKLLGERMLPARPREESIPTDVIISGTTKTQKAYSILENALRKKIKPGQASSLIAAIAKVAEIESYDVLKKDIEELKEARRLDVEEIENRAIERYKKEEWAKVKQKA